MLRKIVVTPSCDTHEFLFTKGEFEGHIGTSLCIMCEFVPFMNIPSHQIFTESYMKQKSLAIIQPLFVEIGPHVITRRDKVFYFHLFKFTRSENEVAWSDLVTKSFANLRDTKWNFLATGSENVLKVEKDTLRRFRPEVSHARFIGNSTHLCLEHEIEIARHGQSWLARTRGRDFAHFFFCCFHEFFEFEGISIFALSIQ
mmetsp:Transcript_2708/g.3645  ORF Transcript_2708/g.3645 Transcript_2708/m.3645 type:complete len:200 (-) Transcript_2708:732-1331(-)